MRWTPGQEKTIETRDKNILVSAAAGSGKTAVLIERIKQLVIKDGTDIDRFLITTFTNAASSEMRERLEKAFRDEMEKEGSDRQFLKRQLAMLPRANISTFHTFALEVMKRYFYLTDLEPGFSIGDEVQVSIFKDEAADELIERRFEDEPDKLGDFLRKYSGSRSEKGLKRSIISIYDEMRSIPEYMSWAEERAKLLGSDDPAELLGINDAVRTDVTEKLREAAGLYRRAAAELRDGGVDSLWEKAELDAEKTEAALAEAEKGCMENTAEFLRSPGFSVMRALKAEQEDYNRIKDRVSALRKRGKKLIDDLFERYFKRSFEEQINELRKTEEDTLYFTGLIEEFETIFNRKKKEKNMVDFDDVMHYAIRILEDQTAAGEYRERFAYIFIDEFQDSNMLQEKIVGSIARENNVFMVGDVKQSIYKFRLAEPEIFRKKYRQYREEDRQDSTAIDLNDNFRSKLNITETVNAVFEGLMEEYDENARLNCRTEVSHPGYKSSIYLIEKGAEEEAETGDDAHTEAALAAGLIKERLGEEIFDVKSGETRNVRYRDMAVLCRSRSVIGEMERYLNNEGIPAYAENTGSYFESVEIQVFMNLLRIVDNTRQDIPLISAMRSAVFDFSVRELAQVRAEFSDGSFYDGVRAYAETGEDRELADRIKDMMERIAHWKMLKNTVPLEELVRTLLYDTGYFDYCSGLPVGKRRIANLRLLVEKAAQFEKSSHSGLYGFLAYAEAMDRINMAVGEAKSVGENEDVVRIMTVHKSKGLEFPIVILAGAGRTIRHRGSGKSAVMHKDMAIALPFASAEERWYRKTILQKAIEARKAAEELEEEIRILYVAMTRAMDGLIVTGCVKDAESLDAELQGKRSFLDMVYGPALSSGSVIHVISQSEDLFASSNACEESGGEAGGYQQETAGEGGKEDEEPERIISFSYPYRRDKPVKSKYSVTELNSMGIKKRSAELLSSPAFSRDKRSLTPAEIGTAVHRVMERLDFKRALDEGAGYIAGRVEAMAEAGILTEEEKAAVDIAAVSSFFEDPVGARAAEAGFLRKEQEFIMEKDIEGASAIVQGVIDCFFEEDGNLILIDYKNGRAAQGEEDRIKERYAGQMELYREALEAASGKKVSESYLYLFDIKKFVEMT